MCICFVNSIRNIKCFFKSNLFLTKFYFQLHWKYAFLYRKKKSYYFDLMMGKGNWGGMRLETIKYLKKGSDKFFKNLVIVLKSGEWETIGQGGKLWYISIWDLVHNDGVRLNHSCASISTVFSCSPRHLQQVVFKSLSQPWVILRSTYFSKK